MKVRYACLADVPSIVALAQQEHAISAWREIPFDPEATAGIAAEFIAGMGRTLLVSDGGYLAGLVQPLGFSRRLVAMEYAWFATDGSGLALLAKFERWAKNMNAAAVVIHAYGGDPRLQSVLAIRRGYGWLGSAMTKNLEA